MANFLAFYKLILVYISIRLRIKARVGLSTRVEV